MQSQTARVYIQVLFCIVLEAICTRNKIKKIGLVSGRESPYVLLLSDIEPMINCRFFTFIIFYDCQTNELFVEMQVF